MTTYRLRVKMDGRWLRVRDETGKAVRVESEYDALQYLKSQPHLARALREGWRLCR